MYCEHIWPSGTTIQATKALASHCHHSWRLLTGMSSDVAHYCNHCITCQTTKALPNHPAPLQPVVASRPWELIGVDILKVPMSAQGNQYILVAQDYFSKWPFAQAIPDQKAERIARILKDQVFTVVGPPAF